MNWKRILMGKISVHYSRFNKFFSYGLNRYWSGRLIDIYISKITFTIDCRLNWLEDMVTGDPA
jgi:ubiquinone/menaquinone biosynthesis C-methylase UbiE